MHTPPPPQRPSEVELAQQWVSIQGMVAAKQKGGLVVMPWNGFRLEQVLAKGAFGTVHLAKYNTMSVAVKVILTDDGFSETVSLVEETCIMNRLAHPNVVKALGVALDVGQQRIGMVMELMATSLHDLMHAGAYSGVRRYLTWRHSLLAIATDITCGMTYLHYHAMLHRDLKPLNVLLSQAWVGKIADFGEVKTLSEEPAEVPRAAADPPPKAGRRTKRGSAERPPSAAASTATADADANASARGKSGGVRIHGTAPYISPEAAAPDIMPVGKPTDVWSFGCLLAHCAAFRPPYTDMVKVEEKNAAVEVINRLRSGKAEPLSMVTPGVNMPEPLVAIARECTRPEPSKRPTFAELSMQLEGSKLVRDVCYSAAGRSKDDETDEEEDEDEDEARRPPVLLRWAEVAIRPKTPPAAEEQACVIS